VWPGSLATMARIALAALALAALAVAADARISALEWNNHVAAVFQAGAQVMLDEGSLRQRSPAARRTGRVGDMGRGGFSWRRGGRPGRRCAARRGASRRGDAAAADAQVHAARGGARIGPNPPRPAPFPPSSPTDRHGHQARRRRRLRGSPAGRQARRGRDHVPRRLRLGGAPGPCPPPAPTWGLASSKWTPQLATQQPAPRAAAPLLTPRPSPHPRRRAPQFNNTRLWADRLAQRGFLVVLPDFFRGSKLAEWKGPLMDCEWTGGPLCCAGWPVRRSRPGGREAGWTAQRALPPGPAADGLAPLLPPRVPLTPPLQG
jgi:hypothetical protein